MNPNPDRDERVGPERIWIDPDEQTPELQFFFESSAEGFVEYVRADLETFVGPCVGCGHNNYNIELKECQQRWMEGNYSVVCGCPCARHNSIANAATRMRDRCVEKVKSMAEKFERESFAEAGNQRLIEKTRVDTATAIAKELEALTLEGEQEKSK